MSSCFGRRKERRNDDTERLLPQYEDDTSLQRQLHQKLHSYQMLRALSKGYMPSTEQLIVNLRTLLASDVLNPKDPQLSDSGRLLVNSAKRWLTQFIELLRHKNDQDQIQDLIWLGVQARVSVDAQDLLNSARSVKTKADVSAAYESLHTVGTLLLTNSDFRLFLSDLNVIGRKVFADTAESVSDVAKEASKKIEPSTVEADALQKPGSENGQPPSGQELAAPAVDASKVVADGLAKSGEEAVASLKDNISGAQRETLLFRLKQAVVKLRRRPDYSDSVSTVGTLLQRYAKVYSRAADSTIGTVQEDVDANNELKRAVENLWSLLRTFGDEEAWTELQARFDKLVAHSQTDPEFETFVDDVAGSVQKLLSDPDFFDSAGDKLERLREKAPEVGGESSLKHDTYAFVSQAQRTLQSALGDEDVAALIKTTIDIFNLLSPLHATTNRELIDDSLHVFLPLLVQAVQYIPIPRLEISAPEVDLLLENVIIEPGRTVNHSSFLPFRFKVETYNDVEVRKARFGTATTASSRVTLKLDGMCVRADEVGFWLRAHSGPFVRLADEGIASFELDERGIDVHLDVELGRERVEQVVSLKAVRVHIHKLSYTLRRSRFACLAWLLKPLLRPIIRKVLERQIAAAIADALHAVNRELLFARERLRATRIADPNDLLTFVKAVATRLTPKPDPDLYTGVGIGAPSKGVFAGVYAPGSVVKVWRQEAERAGEVVDDGAAATKGWRNEVFDVQTRLMGE
ncbi:MAG: hypothetical protein M1825_003891 [Sarcosagium campestre]|nr:MAG: hypothetical protein M1825_003891 [Sarcosagium campestre]